MANHARLASETHFQPNELASVDEEFKDEPDGFGDVKKEEARHNMILQLLDDKIHQSEMKTRQVQDLITKSQAQKNNPMNEVSFANLNENQFGSTNIAINRS